MIQQGLGIHISHILEICERWSFLWNHKLHNLRPCFCSSNSLLALKLICDNANTRTTDTQWRHKSKISEKMGRCGKQNMLPPYLKIWDWEWIFGRAVKAISSLGVRSPCNKTKPCWVMSVIFLFSKVCGQHPATFWFTPQADFPAHNLNFQCKLRWWDWVKANFKTFSTLCRFSLMNSKGIPSSTQFQCQQGVGRWSIMGRIWPT